MKAKKMIAALLCCFGLSHGMVAQEIYDDGWAAPEDGFGVEIPGSKHSVMTRSFWSNWYVSAGITDNAFYSSQEASALSGNPFVKERNAFGFELTLGKWFTPGIGLRTQFDGVWGKSPTADGSVSKFRYMNIHEDVLFNLSNLFYGYNPKRVWNFIPHTGLGFARSFSANCNTLSYNVGIQNTFRINRHLSAYLDVSAMLAPARFDGCPAANPKTFRMRHWDKALTFSVGVTYSLGKKTGWEKSPNLEALLAMDREQISALEMSLEEQQQENMRLAALLEKDGSGGYPSESVDTLALGSGGEDIPLDSIFVPSPEAFVPQSVFFNLGSVEIASRKELVNLKAVAEYAKANELRIVLTGYSDTRSGTPEVNLDISRKRAQTVADELVKMGVPADDIRVVAGGGVDTLTPYSYNRRVVITLEQ